MKLALLIILLSATTVLADPVYIRQKVNGRTVILTVKRETAERLKRHHATEADRKELRAARNWALGVTETRAERRRISCTGTGRPELPHEDLERWLRCPVQNISK